MSWCWSEQIICSNWWKRERERKRKRELERVCNLTFNSTSSSSPSFSFPLLSSSWGGGEERKRKEKGKKVSEQKWNGETKYDDGGDDYDGDDGERKIIMYSVTLWVESSGTNKEETKSCSNQKEKELERERKERKKVWRTKKYGERVNFLNWNSNEAKGAKSSLSPLTFSLPLSFFFLSLSFFLSTTLSNSLWSSH